MNFKSIVWFIKAINIYIYIYICFFCFVLGFFCWFVFFVLFLFLLWGKSLDTIRLMAEEWFPTRVQLSSIRIPFCKVT